jgi:phosphoribosyl-ATP pyrophosphohydrolase / phosphoribosyl-AMP cyclohydrolase / histidinol dehydrogenase
MRANKKPAMTTYRVPYPVFAPNKDHGLTQVVIARRALSAVGTCCIRPVRAQDAEFEAVVTKSFEYAAAVYALEEHTFASTSAKEAAQALAKKCMKQGVALAQRYLTRTLQLDVSIVQVQVLVPAVDILQSQGLLAVLLLDAGCSHVVVAHDSSILVEALQSTRVPRERLIVQFSWDSNNMETLRNQISSVHDYCHKVYLEVTSPSWYTALLRENGEKEPGIGSETFSSGASSHASSTAATGGSNFGTRTLPSYPSQHLLVARKIQRILATLNPPGGRHSLVSVILPTAAAHGLPDTDLGEFTNALVITNKDDPLGVPAASVGWINPTAEQLGSSFVGCIRTDRTDQLYTTVVCTRAGEALGLVYSSRESIIAALAGGRGVYYSRSRQGLWRKGDTSGHFQALHRIDVDCDGDALRFLVTQKGDDVAAFCHLNTLTCWGPGTGLRDLQDTLQSRLASAPAGSYTKRLFNDKELLRNKLVEEAQELAEAETPDDVAGELADLLYFAMVRAVKAGVSIDDAVAELDRRTRKVTRRQGDSKAFRIAAGEAILENNKQSEQK